VDGTKVEWMTREFGGIIAAVFLLCGGTAGLAHSSKDCSTFRIPGYETRRAADDLLDIAVGSDGTVRILDRGGRITVLSPEGALLRSDAVDPKSRPFRLQPIGNGATAILDAYPGRFRILGADGVLSLAFPCGQGRSQRNCDIADFARGPDNELYGLDAEGNRIEVYTADGLFIREIPIPSAIGWPVAIGADRSGHLVIVTRSPAPTICRLPPVSRVRCDGSYGDLTVEMTVLEHSSLSNVSRCCVGEDASVVLIDPQHGWEWWREDSVLVASAPVRPGRESVGLAGCGMPVGAAFDGLNRLFILDAKNGAVSRITLSPSPVQSQARPIPGGVGACNGLPGRIDGLLCGVDSDSSGFTCLYLADRAGRISRLVAADTLYRSVTGGNAWGLMPFGKTTLSGRPLRSPGRGKCSGSKLFLLDPVDALLLMLDKQTGTVLETFGRDREGIPIHEPRDLAVTAGGRVVVADGEGRRLFVIDPESGGARSRQIPFKPGGVAACGGEDVLVWSVWGDKLSLVNTRDFKIQPPNLNALPKNIAGLARSAAGFFVAMDVATQRISILDSEGQENLFCFGPVDAYARPTGLEIDCKGRIYIPDAGEMVTYVYNWVLDLPAPRGLSVRYQEDAAILSWQEVPEPLSDGYEIFCRDGTGKETLIGRSLKPEFAMQYDRCATFPGPVSVSVATVGLSGASGERGTELGLPGLSAAGAFASKNLETAAAFAREAIRQSDDDSHVYAEPGALSYMRLIIFLDALERSDDAATRGAWSDLLENLPREHAGHVRNEIAKMLISAGRLGEATTILLDSVTNPPESFAAADSAAIPVATRAFDGILAVGDTTRAVMFLSNFVTRRAASGVDVSEACLDRLESTRVTALYGRGFRLWKNLQYPEAIEFFTGVLTDARDELSPADHAVGRLVLAAAYYAFSQKPKAAAEYRKILAILPDFDLGREANRLERRFGVVLLNPESRQFFKELEPDAR
jgi:tetratricopeptide (TPR) repeat protein